MGLGTPENSEFKLRDLREYGDTHCNKEDNLETTYVT